MTKKKFSKIYLSIGGVCTLLFADHFDKKDFKIRSTNNGARAKMLCLVGIAKRVFNIFTRSLLVRLDCVRIHRLNFRPGLNPVSSQIYIDCILKIIDK